MNKFKDLSPLDTILNIHKYILSHDVLISERWYENDGNLYSVALSICGSGLSVNGKGTTRAYALASAYGELAERLLNNCLFRMKSNIFLRDIDDNYHKDTYCVDQLVSDELLCNYLKKYFHDSSLVGKFRQYAHIKCAMPKRRVCIFKKFNSDEILELPYYALDIIYASNGMSSGNTREEAMVQGLSEIVERYAVEQCFINRFSLPSVAHEFLRELKNYDEIMGFIKAIEKSGRYKIEIKDMSLGKSLPVMAVVLYDLESSGYLVKVGCHPSLEIAIERCFTELLQGQNIDKYVTIMRINDSYERLASQKNLMSFYINGHAAVPLEFFDAINSFEPLDLCRAFSGNQEMLDYLTDLIQKLGFDIFYHDCSDSNIFAYHLLVPTMSEHNPLSETFLAHAMNDYMANNIVLRGLCNITDEESVFLLGYIQDNFANLQVPISSLVLSYKLHKDDIVSSTSLYLLMFLLYLKCKEFKAAYHCIRNYNNLLETMNKKNIIYKYCEDYMALYADNKEQLIEAFLSKFYSKDTIRAAKIILSTEYLNAFLPVECDYNCVMCKRAKSCVEKVNLEIYRKFRHCK